MATLLTMVNDLRVLLREETVTAISTTDEYTQILVRVINRAAKSVLESRVWSFDKRFDGQAAVGGLVTGTDITHLGGDAVSAALSAITGDGLALGTPNTMSVRFRLNDDTVRPELSYKVASLEEVGIWLTINLDQTWLGETIFASFTVDWTLYVTDVVLPDTVRKVLSVRDEEQPVQLHFSEDEILTDRAQPRPLDATGDGACVIVGSTITATYDVDVDSAGTTGMRMRMLPIPTDDTMLYYTYVYRHPEMTAATDTLADVPDYIIGLIVDHAWLDCLSGNIESDPVRAKAVGDQLRFDMMIAERDDRTAPNRRRVLRSSGRGYSAARLGMGAGYR